MIKEAVDSGRPVLAICRGIQALNVAMGGRLIPDIERCVPSALRHRSVGPGLSRSHEVAAEEDSMVERCYRARRFVVNTRHHQGMTRSEVAEGLRVTALAPDGIVEAVEAVDAAFVVGVQWHPERSKDVFISDISGGLFAAFVDACGGRGR
mgnify:FL=1